jgi:hypothetical protein
MSVTKEQMIYFSKVWEKEEVTWEEIEGLFTFWLESCVGGEIPLVGDYNTMNVVGLLICSLLYKHNILEIEKQNFEELLGEYHEKIWLHEKTLKEMNIKELKDLLSCFQMYFKEMMFLTSDGWNCKINLEEFLILVMHQIGFLYLNEFKYSEKEKETMLDEIEEQSDEWCMLRESSLTFTIQCIHSLMRLQQLLLGAKMISDEDAELSGVKKIELQEFHREASLDDFYEICMMYDCYCGSVLQYKQRFRYLFHSPSQVVFFHWPNYQRRRQSPLEVLRQKDAEDFRVLGLLKQLDPTIPILFEHTKVGSVSEHAKYKFSWCVWGGFVFLMNERGEAFCANDVRTLFSWTQK